MRYPTKLLLTAACYFAGGGLGLLLALPPGNASALWPPAGIALAAILLRGRRLWPGIWLGAFLLEAWLFRSSASPAVVFLLAAAIASAATLQSLFGAWLARRFCGPDLALDTTPSVVRFVGLVAPVACLASPFLSVAGLLAAGILGPAEAGFQAFTWWIGDTLGVLLFVPLLLALFGQPSDIWLPRRLSLALPLLTASLLVTIAFHFSRSQESARAQLEFESQARTVTHAVRDTVEKAMEAPLILRDFYLSSVEVDREEFHRFTRGLLERNPGIQALEWIPRVAQSDRPRHEAAARKEGFPRYEIVERGSSGERRSAAPREEYFPVHFVEPLAGNEKALGYDLASEPMRRAAIEAARASGQLSLSGPIRLIQETGSQHGALAFGPVVKPSGSGAPELLGFTLSVLRIGNLVETALEEAPPPGLRLVVEDAFAPAAERLLYDSLPEAPESVPPLAWDAQLDIGGRAWRLKVTGSAAYLAAHRSLLAWIVHAGGLLFVALVGAFLLVLTGRSARTERMVAERTRELEATRAEAEKASQLLREAVGSIEQGFTIYDENDRLVICNEAYKRFYETSRDLIVPGATFEEIVRKGAERGQYGEAAGRIDEWVKARVAQHQRADGEVHEQPLGDGRWLLIVEHRTPSGFIAGNRIDITELKRVQAALEDRNAQLDTLFMLSPDGFVAFDADERVKFANPAFQRMTGIGPDLILGRPQEALDAALAGRAEQPAGFPGVADCFSAAAAPRQLALKEPRHAVLQLIGVRSQSGSVRKILYLRDVTREAEVDQMKSEFLSHAAHELRTPMASIFGFSELLLHTDLDEATRRDLLASIHEQTRLLVNIINELLDLARIEARRGKDFRIETVDLARLIRDTASSVRLDSDLWPLSIELPGGAQVVRADAGKLRQALTNVLSNARKYSPRGGAVRIAVRRESGAAPRLGIEVADQGIGMTPAQLGHVFERFWRADTSGAIPGTGLGMAIVKEIIELHGGSVDVRSLYGHGTTVTLWLPAALDAGSPAASSANAILEDSK